ncbi:hypothetical protein BaRGS_00010888 [Batillaria attramentaria]|uniref:Uncharacterized protein n=1 Tax=Batillaria attramentaria TaxID=370345 RepID=A0ABD0LFK0_9CAEN
MHVHSHIGVMHVQKHLSHKTRCTCRAMTVDKIWSTCTAPWQAKCTDTSMTENQGSQLVMGAEIYRPLENNLVELRVSRQPE